MARKTILQRRIDAALSKLESPIRDAFIEAMRAQAGAVDFGALVSALDAGEFGQAVRMLQINQAQLFPLGEAIRGSYIAGGAMVEDAIPRGISASFGFDGRHYRAEAWVSQNVGRLIEGIQVETMEMTREVIRDAVERGVGPRKAALDITGRKVGTQRTGGFLGLNSQQTDSIIRGRARLLSGDASEMAKYLKLELRDKRFDRTIAKAIREGKSIPAAKVDEIIAGHKSKALKYRGTVIARTESINALRAGRHEGFEQLIETGNVTPDQIERTWDASGDSRTREDHRSMDGQKVKGMNEPFVAPDGSRMMYPGDSSLGASSAQIIQCRCIEAVRVRYIP